MSVINYSSKYAVASERRRQWQAITGASHLLLDDGFGAEIRGGDVGSARICSVSLGRHRILRDDDATQRGQSRYFKFVFQEEGECDFEQGGRAISLHAGDWCLYEQTRPHHIYNDGFCRQTALLLPYDSSHGDLGRWEALLMHRYPALVGAGRILHDSVTASVGEISCLSEASRHLVGKALASLAELTLLDKMGMGGGVSPSEALRAKVTAHVQKNLNDPDLNIESIAIAMGCSKRYLHKIFCDHGTTIAKLIWSGRLERCYIDLGDPATAGTTITDIAYFWGFNDAQHFSRTFKARYGVTPRQFRKTGSID